MVVTFFYRRGRSDEVVGGIINVEVMPRIGETILLPEGSGGGGWYPATVKDVRYRCYHPNTFLQLPNGKQEEHPEYSSTLYEIVVS